MSEHLCECGKSYKHYPSLYKHQRQHKHGKFSNGGGEVQPSVAHHDNISSPPPVEPETVVEPDAESNDDSTPTWRDFTFEAEIEEATAPIPSLLKGLKRDGRGKKVRNMTGAERDSQRRIIGIAYRTIDGVVQRYGRAVTQDKSYEITRTSNDYEWIGNLTLDMCEEQGLSGIPISATGLWVIGSGYWVGKPIVEIQGKRTTKRRPILSRIPFIGKRFKKKTDEAVQEIIDLDPKGVDNDPSDD